MTDRMKKALSRKARPAYDNKNGIMRYYGQGS